MRSVAVIAAGCVLGLASLAHAFLGWPAMRVMLVASHAPENLIGGLGAGWFFGTAAMVTFGVVVVIAGVRMSRGDESLVVVVRAVAACYIVFGAAAFVARDMNPHFLGFIAMGFLTGIPVMTRRDAKRRV